MRGRRPTWAKTSATGSSAAEVDYLVRNEWARTADDVLWRRTKCGIGMTAAERGRVAACVVDALAAVPA